MQLEIACFTYGDALIAIEGGASRIELCSAIQAGGHTPSKPVAHDLCAGSPVPVFIMIRVAARQFCFDKVKFELMKKQLKFFKTLNCAGFVFGALDENMRVNKKQCKEIVKLAAPLPCTFHRAFDRTPDLEQALEDVVECGFKRVLTSGGKGNAIDNIAMLKKLVKQAGKRIVILPGGGIRANNMKKIIAETGCREIHSAATDASRNRISLKEVKAMRSRLK